MNDGRRIVMLNARGAEGEVSPELDSFLRLVAGEEVKGSRFVDEINDRIVRCVSDPKWLEDYMTFEDELEAARKNAARNGFDKGYDSGRIELIGGLVRDGVLALEEGAQRLGISASKLQESMGA